ncbi:methyltransferase domain-containing protein [Geoglobus sp.]
MVRETDIDRYMDFFYGYMVLKAYVFKLRLVEEYPNQHYLNRWRSFLSRTDFGDLLDRACTHMRQEIDGRILDILDTMERASYYALIHPEHPNITLGFVKDADLWNLWLETGIYRYVRDFVSEVTGIGPGDRVVDFGCGSASPQYYAELVGSSGFYAGVDYSRSLIKIAEKNCFENGLSDRVRLIQNYAESKLEFSREYDVAILSSILEYSDPKAVLKNALNAIGNEGLIVVFSELFSDIEPDRRELFELYYSLIANFREFPSVELIRSELDRTGVPYTMKKYGKHVIVVEVSG